MELYSKNSIFSFIGTSKKCELLSCILKSSFTTVNSGFSVLPDMHFCVSIGTLMNVESSQKNQLYVYEWCCLR